MLKARTVAMGILGLVPFVGIGMWMRAVEPLIFDVGHQVARLLPKSPAVSAEPALVGAEPSADAAGATQAEPELPPTSTTARRAATPKRRAQVTRVVSADQVIEIASAGLCPTGRPVAAAGSRPPGIRVGGVTGLGIGVADGDVLTHVEGVAVRHSGEVVALVLSALARGQRSMTAKVYRGATAYSLVVHLPSVPAATGADAPSGAARATAARSAAFQKRGPSEESRELSRSAMVGERAAVDTTVRRR